MADTRMLYQSCRNAVEELSMYADSDALIDKDIYLAWHSKYENLYQMFNLPPILHHDLLLFHSLYSAIDKLVFYLKYEGIAEAACDEYANGILDEQSINNWLFKYESIEKELVGFDVFFLDTVSNVDASAFFMVCNLKVKSNDFQWIINFLSKFNAHHTDVFNSRVENDYYSSTEK